MPKQTKKVLSLLQKPEVIKKCKDSGIQHLRLFGSHARGKNKKDSDIDLLYIYRSNLVKSDRGFFDAYSFLQDLTGKKIDLVSKEGLLPSIQKHVLNEYIPIY